MKIFYLSKTGNVRKRNEDNILINKKILKDEGILKEEGDFLVAVADGMGGYEEGEIVSEIIFNSLINSNLESKEDIKNSLNIARDEVEKFANKNNIKLGSAIAGILKIKSKLIIFNVGDCRVYRKLFDKFIQLSKDHTIVSQLIQDGIITKEESKKYQKNMLTSAIVSDMKEFDIFFNEVKLLKNDKILICSDGFWEEFEDEFLDIFNSENPLQKVKELEKNKELKDNYSFVFIDFN